MGPDKIKSDFSFVMLFADRLPRSRVVRLIDEHIAHARTTLAALETADLPPDSAGASFSVRYGIAMAKANIDFLERNRHFVEAAARDDTVTQTPQAETAS